MLQYLYHNGDYNLTNTPLFTAANRAFRYGDSIFESMAMQHGNIPLFSAHWQRLTQSAKLLQIELPENMQPDAVFSVCRQLKTLNGNLPHARIRLSVYRSDGGLYLPQNNTGNLLIELTPQQTPCFCIGLPGVKVALYPQPLLFFTPFSHLKTGNSLPYIAARLFAEEQGVQDCLLLNHLGEVAESTNANVFWMENGRLFTPPLTSGCVNGVMRETLLQHILPEMNLTCTEKPLQTQALLKANEVLLTNATLGIRHVATLNGKNYGNTVSETIQNRLLLLTQCNV
ncbi:hypothetical protein B6N25_03245 [Sphingobacteriales bacterium TSM_CSS]|nr:hypothetical protein B6N25_03245 [Sphingobacteriales bacterium TSM_CSS]